MPDAIKLAFERAGVERVAQADQHALGARRLDDEIDRAGAHRRDHVVDAAMRGLHDHRYGDGGLAQSGENAETVEVRHYQVENDAIDTRAVRPGEQRQCGVAIVERDRLIAELLQHALEQPALHRIVVDDEDGHQSPCNQARCAVSGHSGRRRLMRC